MKKLLLISLLFIASLSFSQSQNKGQVPPKYCDLRNLHEPKASDSLRRIVAAENNCKLQEVKFISFSQTKNAGMYTLCVAGIVMRYKMVRQVFSKLE